MLFLRSETNGLWGDNVTLQPEVVNTLCETVAAGTNLKKMGLGDVHLCQVNQHLLGRMATQMAKQLEELYLCGNSNNENERMRDQIGTIVEAIANTEAGTLKILRLHTIDLSLVEDSLLARMATQVEDLQLDSDVDEDQAKAIFEAIHVGPGRLKELSIPTVSDGVDANILASAVNNLEFFFQEDSGDLLSNRFLKKILSKALEGTSLKKLIFQGKRRHMKSRLVKEAKKVIPYISIRSEQICTDFESESASDSDSGHEIESESDFESNSDLNFDSDSDSDLL